MTEKNGAARNETMRYAFFSGCNLPYRMPATLAAVRALMGAYSVELLHMPEFTCCGYPVRNLSLKASLAAAARNLALAEKNNLDVTVLCACCYHSLRQSAAQLARDPRLADEVNGILRREGLEYKGRVRVEHALSMLYSIAGPSGIAERVVRPMEGVRVACHYGCHLLRPRKVACFDDPFVPTILDEMVRATGAEAVPWERKMDCCGAPVLSTDRDLSLSLAMGKLKSAEEAGARRLCTVCSYCQLFLEDVRQNRPAGEGKMPGLLITNYTELFCEALGISRPAREGRPTLLPMAAGPGRC